jgi:hypothetical protein
MENVPTESAFARQDTRVKTASPQDVRKIVLYTVSASITLVSARPIILDSIAR